VANMDRIAESYQNIWSGFVQQLDELQTRIRTAVAEDRVESPHGLLRDLLWTP